MTPVLRSVHRFTWIVLAGVLPAVWVAALMTLSDPPVQTPVRRELPPALPVVRASKQSGLFLVNLRSDDSGNQRQLELFIQKPVAQPNTLIWLAFEDSVDILLGSLGTRGVYRFPVEGILPENRSFRIRMTDQIQQRLLREITFENLPANHH